MYFRPQTKHLSIRKETKQKGERQMLCARSFPLDENPLLCHYYKKSPSNFLIITRIHQCLILHVCLSSNSITRKADSGLHRFNVLLFLHPKEQYSETKI